MLSPAVTPDSVKHQLELDEAADLSAGVAYHFHEDISASTMLTMGMDFDIQQYVPNSIMFVQF